MIDRFNKTSRKKWLVILMIVTILLSSIPVEKIYAETYENNVVTINSTTQWEKKFYYSGDYPEEPEEIDITSLFQTEDGGYIALSYHPYGYEPILMKLDKLGNKEWVQNFSSFESIKDVQEKPDGGYIILAEKIYVPIEGIGNTDWYIAELDKNGNKIKEITVGENLVDIPQKIELTKDGGYIVIGSAENSHGGATNTGDYDCWILKLDNDLNQVWLKKFGDIDKEKGMLVRETNDGGYIAIGSFISLEATPEDERNYKFWILKLDKDGEMIWEKRYGGTIIGSSYNYELVKAIEMQLTDDGGYVFLAGTQLNNGDIVGNHGGMDYWFVKLNASGEIVYQKSYGGSNNDIPIDFEKTLDGGYMIVGESSSNDGDFDQKKGDTDFWFIKIDENGELLWKWNYGSKSNKVFYDIESVSDDGYELSMKIDEYCNFIKFYPGARPYVDDLKIDNKTIENFKYNILDYEITLPHGTTIVPIVTASLFDMNATANIIQADSLPGTTQIEVIKDEVVLNTYSINFKLEKNNNAYLNDLKVNNQTVADFVYTKGDYEIKFPYGTTDIPTVTATPQDTNANVNITNPVELPGTAQIIVMAEDKSTTKTYTIKYVIEDKPDDEIEKNDNAYLNDLKVNNQTVAGFVYTKGDYEIKFPYGTTDIPTVTATPQDTNANVNITNPVELPGTAQIIVTAEDESTTKTYTIKYVIEDKPDDEIEKNNNAYLNTLKVNNQTVTDFVYTKGDYEIKFPYGTTDIPTVTATAQDTNANVNITNPVELPGTAQIIVTAEDESTTNTYTIKYVIKDKPADEIEKNNNAYLNNLKVNNQTVAGFVYTKGDYEIKFPYGTTDIPTVTVILQDTNAKVNITNPVELPGTAQIIVTAEDESTTKTYTIKYVIEDKPDDEIEKNNNAYLNTLKVNNQTVAGFVYTKGDYEIKFPYGTIDIPTVTATPQDTNANVNITNPAELPGTAQITVTAEDESTIKTYTIKYVIKDKPADEIEKNNNAYLNTLKVNNQTVADFVYTKGDYEIKFPYGTTDIPTVTATPQDTNANVNIINPVELPGTAQIIVTAEDESTKKTYTIKYVIKDKPADENESNSDNNDSNESNTDNNNGNNSKSSNNSSNSTGISEQNSINELEKAKKTLKDRVDLLNNENQYKQEKVNSILETTNKVERIIQTVENKQEIISSVDAMIEKTGEALANEELELEKKDALEDALIRLGEKAMARVGQIEINPRKVKIVKGTAYVNISFEEIKQEIENIEKNFNLIKERINNVVGQNASEEAKASITINVPNDANNIQKLSATFQTEILTKIQEKNIDNIIVNMNYVGFTVEPNTFKNIEQKRNITLESDITQKKQAYLQLPKDIEKIDNMLEFEINAKIDDQQVTKFNRPMEVFFNVSYIDLSKYSKEDLESLTVYIYDNDTNSWNAVGGKYDPITKMVKVYRIHLSRYTIMKSNKSFSDVKDNSSEKEINILLKKGILKDEDEFMPNEEVTREEFIGWLSKNFGLEEKELDTPFKDVSKSDSNYKEIAAAFNQGLISGKSQDIFDPKGSITKQEAAVVIAKALEKYENIKAPEDINKYLAQYTDQDKIASWSKDAIAMVSKKRLSNQVKNGYNPNTPMLRADAATMIYNIQDRS